jgi:hypothetical protein
MAMSPRAQNPMDTPRWRIHAAPTAQAKRTNGKLIMV